jgi:hypothetical protein
MGGIDGVGQRRRRIYSITSVSIRLGALIEGCTMCRVQVQSFASMRHTEINTNFNATRADLQSAKIVWNEDKRVHR